MKLIDLLVQELPKRGGWPIGAAASAQDNDGEVCFYANSRIHRSGNNLVWSIPALGENKVVKRRIFMKQAEDMTESIVTREQYEASLAVPAWNGEGLPPVGCEFEYGAHRSVAKCIAVSYHHVFASKGDPDDENSDYEEFLIDIQHSSFYPVSFGADRKRIEIAQQLCDSFGNGIKVDDKKGFGKTWLNLYDAIAAHQIDGITTVPTASQIVRCTEKCSREDAERIVAMLTSGTIAE